MQKNRLSDYEIRLPLILAFTLALGMFIGHKLPDTQSLLRFVPGSKESSLTAGALDEVLRYVEAKYVDTVDVLQLKEMAISQVLAQLDPHSVYISPEEIRAVEEDMSGNFEGIGIEFLIIDDTIRVVTPLSGGPSEAAGILSGDKIITIEDSLVAGVQIDQGKIFKKLRGTKGSKVNIGILRPGEKALRRFEITRDVIPVNSIDIAYLLDDNTAYIKVNRFTARTFQEFVENLKPLEESRNQPLDLVIDLRGNPGGYFNEAVDILSQLFPKGKLLVYTMGRTEERFNHKSTGRTQLNIRQVAVLIDEGSASASEIVAGAVQDHDRGWVIGRRSFGKGLVQQQYPLSDGGALRLTISRYYTPSGRSIQRPYKNQEDYGKEASRRLHNGELSDSSLVVLSDSTPYYTGMGRVVYGGGGITPDVFVPLDTSFVNDYFFATRALIPAFAASWLDKQDNKKLPDTIEKFIRNFSLSSADMEEFVAYAEEKGIKKQDRELARCRTELQHLLRARIARLLFKDEGYYRVLNDDDPAMEKALQLLRNGTPVAGK